MNFKQFIIIVSAFCLSLNFQSCNKDGTLPDLSGNLVGYVYTLDEFSKLLSDQGGVLITALGVKKEFHTFSDENGRFELKGLPSGTYELHFEKQGFGTLKQFGIKHLGGEPTILGMPFDHSSNGSAFFLYEFSDTEITYLEIKGDSIFGRFSFTESTPLFLSIRLYYSSEDNFELKSAQLETVCLVINYGEFYKGKLYNNNFSFIKGEKVFFRACVSPFYEGSIQLFNNRSIIGIGSYFDYESNAAVYPVLGKESAQYSFIVL